MKKTTKIILILMISITTATANAFGKEGDSFTAGFALGMANPAGHFSDLGYESIFGMNAYGEYPMTKEVSLTGGIGYYSFNAKHKISTEEWPYFVIPLSLGFKYFFNDYDFIKPYGGAEISANIVSTEWLALVKAEPSDYFEMQDDLYFPFGLNLTIGSKIILTQDYGIDFNVKYNIIFDDYGFTSLYSMNNPGADEVVTKGSVEFISIMLGFYYSFNIE